MSEKHVHVCDVCSVERPIGETAGYSTWVQLVQKRIKASAAFDKTLDFCSGRCVALHFYGTDIRLMEKRLAQHLKDAEEAVSA